MDRKKSLDRDQLAHIINRYVFLQKHGDSTINSELEEFVDVQNKDSMFFVVSILESGRVVYISKKLTGGMVYAVSPENIYLVPESMIKSLEDKIKEIEGKYPYINELFLCRDRISIHDIIETEGGVIYIIWSDKHGYSNIYQNKYNDRHGQGKAHDTLIDAIEELKTWMHWEKGAV